LASRAFFSKATRQSADFRKKLGGTVPA
jgi:hypothetical protein